MKDITQSQLKAIWFIEQNVRATFNGTDRYDAYVFIKNFIEQAKKNYSSKRVRWSQNKEYWKRRNR